MPSGHLGDPERRDGQLELDHVLPGLVSPSVTVPVSGGTPLLGTWQSVVLVDLNRDNPHRSVRLSFLGG